MSGFCGRGGRIRTYDLLLPKQARYRATLHPDWCFLVCKDRFFYCHKKTKICNILKKVGMTGFEPATPRPPDVYATGLRYIPKIFAKID